MAFALARMRPVEATQFFRKRVSSYRPHATQMIQAAIEMGARLQEGEADLRTRLHACEQVSKKSRAQVVSLDGANVLMREPEAAKRGRPAERPGLGNTQFTAPNPPPVFIHNS